MNLLEFCYFVILFITCLLAIVALAMITMRAKSTKSTCSRSNGVSCTPEQYMGVCGPSATKGKLPDEIYDIEQSCSYMCNFYANKANACSYTSCWSEYDDVRYAHCND